MDARRNTTILSSVLKGNRAIAGALRPGAWGSFGSCASGGGLSSWGGTPEIRGSRFVGNQAIGGNASLAGPPTVAMGGGITVYSGLPATVANCSLLYNSAVGGAGSGGTPGAAGVGGGLNVGLWPSYMAGVTGPNTAVTVSGTTISQNQAIGGAGGGQGLGGGYAVATCLIIGRPDTSSVSLNGRSVVTQNQPDDAYHFWSPPSAAAKSGGG